MRIAMLIADGRLKFAGLRGEEWVDLCASDPALPPTIDEWLEQEEISPARLAPALIRAPAIRATGIRFLPPISRPRKILCVGKNYAAHAREMGTAPPEEPLIFSKLVTTLIGHQDEIILPPVSSQVDYEAELVVVIGKRGRNIPEAQARQYVLGYMCGQDVSARDWQKTKPGGQWLLGKSFDTFAPTGPYLVTADEIPDPGNLDLMLRLNGRLMQQSNTRNMIYSIPYLIAYLSQVCTLEPGDLLFTGTPDGVGFARQPPVFLTSGDMVEVTIAGVGQLQNRVVASNPVTGWLAS